MKETTSIYQDMAQRTGGSVYIGVVGPVRTGKSTFVKRFMETLVLPHIDNAYRRDRAQDELPQSGSGRTIMTAEPKFVPEEAVQIRLEEGAAFSVRLVDCVGSVSYTHLWDWRSCWRDRGSISRKREKMNTFLISGNPIDNSKKDATIYSTSEYLIKSGGGIGPVKPRQPVFSRCQIRRTNRKMRRARDTALCRFGRVPFCCISQS